MAAREREPERNRVTNLTSLNMQQGGNTSAEPESPSSIEIDNVSLEYKKGEPVVRNISFSVRADEFVCIIGPSGCGKSTLLKSIAGFVPITSGSVSYIGKKIEGAAPERGMVFQDFALFPWLTVEQNIAFGDQVKSLPKKDQLSLVDHYLSLIGLSDYRNYYPKMLSGGMKQRVALARSWANKPGVLLMDEPFGALDARTRQELQKALLQIWATERTTCLFVTHDTVEAVLLADRILALDRNGRLANEFKIDLSRPRNRYDPRLLETVRQIDERVWE